MATCVRGLCLATLLALFLPTSASADTLTADSVSGAASDAVSVAITVDNDVTLRAFSFGVSHDDGVATLDDILVGEEVLATNSDDGPDYYQVNVDPEGGPGGFVACIVDFELDNTLGAANGQELAVFEFTIASDATPGDIATLDFTDDLGDPAVLTMLVPEDVGVIPDLVSGEIQVTVPPVSDLECTLIDPCDCGVVISWINGGVYASIKVLDDGVEVANLGGDATTHNFDLAANGLTTISVVPVGLNDLEADATTCEVDCPVVPAPDSPENLVCSTVVTDVCTVTMTWENPQEYGALEVSLNGEVQETLDGDATTATVVIEGNDVHTLSLSGVDNCDTPFTAVECEVDCVATEVFKRGDGDGNGTFFALLDALHILAWAFTNGPVPPCLDAADADGNNTVFALIDSLYILSYGFTDGPIPPDPGPDDCGPDDDLDEDVDCETPQENC